MTNSIYNHNPKLYHCLYKWYEAYVESIAEYREVWLVATHKRCMCITYSTK